MLKIKSRKNELYAKAYQFYLDGYSYEAIGAIIGVSAHSVYKAFKRRGFKIYTKPYRLHQVYDNIKFTRNRSGYYSMSGKNRMLMHRYVWEKEKWKIPPNWDVHHINRNRADNRIENLKCLPKGLHTRLFSPSNNQFGKGKRPIEMIDINTNNVIRKFSSTTLAAKELGIDGANICRAINGFKTYKNYKWRYAGS